ncbi:MAG: sigma-70 family RNA polymerase sigma factor [Bdellovibrionales bacterium]|jgi:RNA polymerase primary sigma factor
MTEILDQAQDVSLFLTAPPFSEDDDVYEQGTYSFRGDEDVAVDQEECVEADSDEAEGVILGTGDLALDDRYINAVVKEAVKDAESLDLLDPEIRKAENLAQFNRMITAQRKMVDALLQIPHALKTIQKWYAGVADGSVTFNHVIVRGDTYKALSHYNQNPSNPNEVTSKDVLPLCRVIGDDCAALMECQSVGGRGKQEQDYVDILREMIAAQIMGIYFKKKDWWKLSHAIDKSSLPLKYPQACAEMKAAQAEIKSVEDYFVTTNKGFVYSLASKMNPNHDEVWDKEDRYQAGNDGLLMALEKWIPERSVFLTYAKRWIVQRIMRAQDDEALTIRLPTHAVRKHKNYIALRMRYQKEHGVYPAPEEMAELMKEEGIDITAAMLETFHRMPKAVYVPKGNDDDGPREFACDKIKSPFAVLYAKEQKEVLSKVMACLTPKEARVIALHNGLSDPLNPNLPAKEHSLEAIGKMYCVTRERIRQIEVMALKKMKVRGRNAFPRYEP